MCRYLNFIQKKWRQQGAILAFTALLLPMIIACTGLAVDFGNIYWHKALLQNCADSSALGGAKIGVKTGIFIKNDADNKADELLEKNKRYVLEKKDYQYLPSKKNPGSKYYYTVTLYEKVPMFFLRYFGFDSFDIMAKAKVLIKGTGQKDALSCLFCYRDKLYVVRAVKNNSAEILKSFDGDIVYTNDIIASNNYKKDLSSHLERDFTEVQTSGIKHFYKTKGLKDIYHDDENDISDPIYKENMKLHVKSLDDKIIEQYKLDHNNLPRNISSKDLDNKNSIRCYESSTLKIDREIEGDENDPIYVYVQESDSFHLEVTANSRRPVIICQIKDPNNPGGRGGSQVTMTGVSGVTFRGILYFPDLPADKLDAVDINEHYMSFSGSIVAPSISTQGEASYKYESFIKGSSGEGSSVSVSSDVSLVGDDD